MTMVVFMRLPGAIGLLMAAISSALAATAPGNIDSSSLRSNQGLSAEPKLWRLIQNEPYVKSESQQSTQQLNTLKDIYAAIRHCYMPPRLDRARPGMRMTVQFAFTRAGDIFGKPRILYETTDATPEQQSAYRMAVAAALARCSPLPFSKSLGNAVAGRVLAMQFIDERNLRGAQRRP
jgi:hypothetical protein